MLVLTRKVGEAIAIGDDIKIIIMQVRGQQVRLGVKAGLNTIVHREEVYQRIKEENQKAAHSAVDTVSAAQAELPPSVTSSTSATPLVKRRAKPPSESDP